MKIQDKAIASIAVASMMVAMTACGGTPDVSQPSGGEQPGQVAMGRYVERDCALPAVPNGLLGLDRAADGTVSMFAAHEGTESWRLFTSADNGDTWSDTEQGLIEASGLTQLDAICRKADGGILVSGTYFSEEFMKQLEEFQASGDSYSEELDWPPMQLMDISPDGTAREIPIKLPPNAAGSISRMMLAPSGELAAQSYNEIYRFVMTTGALLGTIETDSFISSIAFSGGKLVAMSDGIATIYDFESGDPLEVVDQLGFSQSSTQLNVSSTDDAISSVTALGEDGALYFCTGTGIYRKTADGGVVERIVDGTLVSLGSPSVKLTDMLVVEDGFLVAMRDTANDSVMVKKYAFDQNVPTLPDKSLRIYSLTDNKTLRQTITEYQRTNPDTHVVLEVAPAELSTGDAVRALNTQLLAGQGPDILVLDGMPIDSYLEKKVLMPLDASLLEGTLANITQAGRSADGNLYYLPMRFAMPAITVDSSVPKNLGNITTFTDAVVTLSEKQKDNTVSIVLQNCGGAILINTLYPVFEQTLQTDGKPDEAKLRGFLEQLKRITDLQDNDKRFVTDTSPYAILDMQWTPITWCTNTEVMGIGNITSFRDFANANSAVEMKQGRLEPLSPAGSHPFVPLINLGICESSSNAETAGAFIKMALSQPIQECDFKDGLPVNSAALDGLLTRDEDDAPQMGAYGMSDENGETTAINIHYPTAEAMTALRGMIDTLDTPTNNNRVLMDLLRNETAAYFSGTRSLDDTMTTLWQKLKLLEAE